MLKIREFRKNQKMTIRELAELSGMSISYISQIERGEIDPSLSSLYSQVFFLENQGLCA